jgi:hypothetical protein
MQLRWGENKCVQNVGEEASGKIPTWEMDE